MKLIIFMATFFAGASIAQADLVQAKIGSAGWLVELDNGSASQLFDHLRSVKKESSEDSTYKHYFKQGLQFSCKRSVNKADPSRISNYCAFRMSYYGQIRAYVPAVKFSASSFLNTMNDTERAQFPDSAGTAQPEVYPVINADGSTDLRVHIGEVGLIIETLPSWGDGKSFMERLIGSERIYNDANGQQWRELWAKQIACLSGLKDPGKLSYCGILVGRAGGVKSVPDL